MNTLKVIRYAAWAVVAVLAIATAWLLFAGRTAPDGSGGTLVATALGGPFSVVDQTGATVTEAALQGHPSALFFGYTFCPDVCPTTLAEMTQFLQQLGPDADKLKVYFVTVDPERDTREQMALYLQAFDPRIIGLTGSRAAIDGMLNAFRVYSKKVEGGDPAYYTMDHSASVFLLDSEAKFVGTIDYQENRETALAKLKRLVAG